MTDTNSYDSLDIDTHAKKAYLDYALAVVKGRALPAVHDGEKPVQVRILYAMQDMGLTHTAKLRKCAAVVGEVLGKYHPHGDSSVYDALVRMAQHFTLRYPLIEGQGNFGSRDGDGAAAMRYTEARLMPVAQLLLSELGSGTVDFSPNYDGSWFEPSVLPARLPMLLLNGASGIAVGMACEFPSHNLREVAAAAVAVIENPAITTDELLNIVPGPDFATGAQLISSRAEILAAYESGRGNLRARALWKKEELARNNWQIVITDFPYQVSATKVMQEIEVLTNPQVKSGKKTLDQQQINLKTVSLNLLETVRDESGKDAGVRLVIVPRSSKQTPEETMAFLFANTSLEESVPVNNTCIGLDGNPRTKGLKELLTEWAHFRHVTVRRRTQYELDKVTARLHLLEGRMAVYLNVDQVVAAIRDAEDPKADIMAKFSLTEVQAEDILEMRLRALARLEGFKLEKEVEDCRKEKSRLELLVSNPDALNKLIIKEIKADSEKYGDDRRTLIKAEARASASPAARVVPNEPVTIIVSKNMWVRARNGHDVDEATLTFKAGDEKLAVLKTRTTESVLFLDSKGRAYTVQASDIPASGRGDGVPLTTLIEVKDGAFIRFCLADHAEQNYLFAGNSGYGFISALKNMVARPKAGKAFLTLGEGEEPMRPVRITSTDDGFVACGSSEAKMLCFPVNEVKQLGGGKGVMLMGLDGSETLTGVTYFGEMPFNAKIELKEQIGEISFGKADLEKYLGRRARKGAVLPKKGLLRG